MPPFTKILVANRGEIAIRIIRACREMGITAAAVYSDADRDALHVRLADEAHYIGGSRPSESYLHMERLIQVAKTAAAEALHPGYGFLSENPAFADACERAGLVFVGPSADTLRLIGNKALARRAAQAAGVPIVPGSVSSLNSHGEVAEIAEEVGYPVLVKAAAGGGGKGMRVAYCAAELRHAIDEAAGEAGWSFGDTSLYVEKLIDPARHVEVQLLADNYGAVLHMGERDCSIQRRYQKVIEESPSPAVDERLRSRLVDAAIRVARAIGYRNAGTIEFLVDGDDYYFMEVNARLQVEHPITELITNVDLAKEQIFLAAGEPMRFRQEDVVLRGHSIQCRIYAEDPAKGFIPSPGVVQAVRHPGGPGVRIDGGVEYGSAVPMEYDGLLAKLVVWGNTRGEAIDRMRRALHEYHIVGVDTTVQFKKFVMESELFRSGSYDTSFTSKIWGDWIAHCAAAGD